MVCITKHIWYLDFSLKLDLLYKNCCLAKISRFYHQTSN